MDQEVRELERKVLAGDASLLPALRRAYHRVGPIEDEPERTKAPSRRAPILIPQPVTAQARRRPLWDKVLIPPTRSGESVSCWAFDRAVGEQDPISGECKLAADTSVTAHGILPAQESLFMWHAVSVVPDSGSSASDVESAWNDLALEFLSTGPTGAPTHRWPLRDLMRPPTVMPQDENGVLRLAGTVHTPRDVRLPGRRRVLRPQGPVTINARFPLEITWQSNARLRIVGVLRRRTESVVRLMLILHGVLIE